MPRPWGGSGFGEAQLEPGQRGESRWRPEGRAESTRWWIVRPLVREPGTPGCV